MAAEVTVDELINLLGSKEAELYALRRNNAKLAELASNLNQRLADLEARARSDDGLPPGWKLVRVHE